MKAIYRALRRLVRKAIKPLCLRFTEWQDNRAEAEVHRCRALRHSLVQREVLERRRQVVISMRRNMITRW